MILPLRVRFLHMDAYKPAEEWVREAAAKLDELYPKIISCRVVIEVPHQEREWGNPYQVRIDLSVPGKELVVMHEPDLHSTVQRLRKRKKTKQLEVKDRYKNLHVAIRDAFDAVRRQLRDYVRVRRRQVKTHVPPPRARISRLFPEEDYGIMTTPEGRDLYFHRHSVLQRAFDRLKVGDEVTFTEEKGEKGAQASTVKLTRNQRRAHPEKKVRRSVRSGR